MEDLILNPDPFGSHNQIIKRITPNSIILDVGCSNGAIGEFLIKNKKCRVYGVELLKNSANIALKKGYAKVLIKNLNQIDNLPFPPKFFDFIICADVLEHLENPLKMLKILKPHLKKKGFIIASIPNIANWYSRLRLLFGNWEYGGAGLFDETHLRFFNLKTAKQLFIAADFKINEIDYTSNLNPQTFALIFEQQKSKSSYSALKKKIIPLLKLRYNLMRIYPRLFAIQFIIKAQN
ncbi:SAM-dependent methyltransferase [Candidatus Pacearchaeota archaeon CG06_land_8_20_14_3_00_35_12]|nr:MAG: SAM-dependent methyltransferase [Candidatus Pacearchaeota archaeon CG06_land_8_20_14_3_00_35_12]